MKILKRNNNHLIIPYKVKYFEKALESDKGKEHKFKDLGCCVI